MIVQENTNLSGFLDTITGALPDITSAVSQYYQTQQQLEKLEEQRRLLQAQREAAEAMRVPITQQAPLGIPMNVLLIGGVALVGTVLIVTLLRR